MNPRTIDYFLKLATEMEVQQDFSKPNLQDEQDLKILMQRVMSALSKEDYLKGIQSLKSLDRGVREFQHESFEEDFYDFMSDQDIWDKLYNLSDPLTSTELNYLVAMKDLCGYFLNQTLFKK